MFQIFKQEDRNIEATEDVSLTGFVDGEGFELFPNTGNKGQGGLMIFIMVSRYP